VAALCRKTSMNITKRQEKKREIGGFTQALIDCHVHPLTDWANVSALI
jgi:hypothetical protein